MANRSRTVGVLAFDQSIPLTQSKISGGAQLHATTVGKATSDTYVSGLQFLRSLYNNIKPPSWVASGADFHLFKKGIEPKWEDPRCEHGGKWTVLVPKGPSGKQTMDTYWLNAVRIGSFCIHKPNT